MKKETDLQRIGRLVKMEGGKSRLKIGDARTLENLIFDEILKDPTYLAKGLEKAFKRALKKK
jgi:hypothetical protein